MKKETKILKDFFDLMLIEFEWEKEWAVDKYIDNDWHLLWELNPIVRKWIDEWVKYNEEEVQERIKKELINKNKRHKKLIEHDFSWLWLDYAPKKL